MPSHAYYRELAYDCLEELDARDHLLDSYATVEKTCALTRALIEDGEEAFVCFVQQEIGHDEAG